MKMFLRFIWSFLKFNWAKIRGYDPIAPTAEVMMREGRCSRCCHYDDGQCRICKCLILSKTLLATEACPVGRWDALWRKLDKR